jgi:hypothetical protein
MSQNSADPAAISTSTCPTLVVSRDEYVDVVYPWALTGIEIALLTG